MPGQVAVASPAHALTLTHNSVPGAAVQDAEEARRANRS